MYLINVKNLLQSSKGNQSDLIHDVGKLIAFSACSACSLEQAEKKIVYIFIVTLSAFSCCHIIKAMSGMHCIFIYYLTLFIFTIHLFGSMTVV